MVCPKCGRENPEGARYCRFCGTQLAGEVPEAEQAGAPSAPPRTSEYAIASLVLGILAYFTVGLLAIPGLVMGILGYRQTRRTAQALKGAGLAIAGMALSGLALLLVLLGVGAILIFAARERALEAGRAAAADCPDNLRQVANALLQYTIDWDGQFPVDAWCDGVQPYVRGNSVFMCPEAAEERCGYVFNAALRGKSVASVAQPPETVLVFDGRGGWNAVGGAEAAEARHEGGCNVAFVDGHVVLEQKAELQRLVWQAGREPVP